MPLSHRKLSAWYHHLAQQLDAGLPMVEALRSSRDAGAPAAAVDAMTREIERGGSVVTALHAAARWLPLADRVSLAASAQAGRMPSMLRALAVRHREVAAAQFRVVLACAYPFAILHLGLLLLPVVRMIDWETGFRWDAAAYMRGVAVTLIPLWAVGAALLLLARRQSSALTRIARAMPALRGYVRAQALANFSFVLGNALQAGIPIGQAWATAGQVSRSPELQTAAKAMEAAIARGEAPGPKLTAWRCFPPDFAASYRTGESTGQLEANLLRLTAQNQEAANRALTFATMLYPALMAVAVAAAVAYFAITIYAGYLKMLSDLAA